MALCLYRIHREKPWPATINKSYFAKQTASVTHRIDRIMRRQLARQRLMSAAHMDQSTLIEIEDYL